MLPKENEIVKIPRWVLISVVAVLLPCVSVFIPMYVVTVTADEITAQTRPHRNMVSKKFLENGRRQTQQDLAINTLQQQVSRIPKIEMQVEKNFEVLTKIAAKLEVAD